MIKFFIARFFESVFRFNSSSALSNSSSWLLQLFAFKKVPTQDFDCKLLGNSAIVLVSGACQKYFLSVSIFSMSEVKVEKNFSKFKFFLPVQHGLDQTLIIVNDTSTYDKQILEGQSRADDCNTILQSQLN